MVKKTKIKYVYLVSGWTNYDRDADEISKQYRLVNHESKSDTLVRPKINLKSPCKIIGAEQQLTRDSAYFSTISLYHLGLIPLNKENKQLISNNMYGGRYNKHKLDNVRVIPGRFDGIELMIEEIQPSLLGIDLDRIMIPTRKGDGVFERSNPLAGVPRHCRILSGEKALDELTRRGYEPFVPFFKKAVEKYEGKNI